ncbi:MAG: hypothetical protein EBU90_07095 [Proteobacteria bacterium]|nr:hypothetical protein [Pseudomonadota bacterium]NBP14180.1 hypothetical protein [bacterium]
MYDCLSFIEKNTDDHDPFKFSLVEFERFRRIVKYMETTVYDNARTHEGRKDFYNWFTALDQRRGTNFQKTFPEMKEFYKECSKKN